MVNKQPFYHRVDGLLFTATRPVSESEFLEFFTRAVANKPDLEILPASVEIEEYSEPDPGDPADLMG